MSSLAPWVRQPQTVWLRKALFQIHLWSGIGIGLYLVVISVTGSVLVFRSELRQTFQPQPRYVEAVGERMNEEQILEAAQRAVAFEPENANILDTLAEVHFRLGQVEQAIAVESRALALTPDDAYLKEQLARFRGEGR